MKGTASLRRMILARTASVAVLGQGYVGLSLACEVALAGFSVVGLDVDAARVDALSEGEACVPGVAGSLLDGALATGRVAFSTDEREIEKSDLVFVCVPTPLRDQAPDLSFVDEACHMIGRNLRPGSLVVLESTSYPGTTSDFVRPILESFGLVSGRDFLLAFSPERIDPGNTEFTFQQVPRIVGGHTPDATGPAVVFYEQLVDKVVAVSSARSAELAKLLENAFRHTNIALVNEMAVLCHEQGIDIWEVIAAASSKPFGFMRFEPGPGVGGHCIPLDPTYLTWQVRRDVGRPFRLLEQAQDINSQMPAWVVERLAEALSDAGKPLKNARVLVLGVAYKPDIADPRESPSVAVMAKLQSRGAIVSFHDPHIAEVETPDGLQRSTKLTKLALASNDCVALLTPHAAYDLAWIAEHSALIFDARDAFGPASLPNVVRL